MVIVGGLVLLVGLTAGSPDDQHELADPTHLGPRLVVISVAATALVGLGLFAFSSARPWLRAGAIIAMLLLCGVMIGLFEDLPDEPPGSPDPPPAQQGETTGESTVGPVDEEPRRDGWSTTSDAVLEILGDLWLLLAAATTAATAVLVARHLGTRRRAAPLEPVGAPATGTTSGPGDFDAARRRVVEALDQAIVDLPEDGDPRATVLAAYVRMTDALAEHAIPRAPSDTPLEFLARALAALDASADAIRRLTDLLEVAMFSTRTIDRAMANQAVAAFAEVRDELRSPTWVGVR